MTKVFIAGSRWLSGLNAEVKRRIDRMVEKGFAILVGDGNGADKQSSDISRNRGTATWSSTACLGPAATTWRTGPPVTLPLLRGTRLHVLRSQGFGDGEQRRLRPDAVGR